MKDLKLVAICLASLALLNACGGGGGGGGGGSSGPSPLPAPNPVAVGTGVNIGNVSTIPVGLGGGSTSAIITNNFPVQVLLTSATYTLYNASGAGTPKDATTAGGPVNTSLCTAIQGLGTCSLGLTVPAGSSSSTQEGQYLVTMNFINPASGQIVTTSQLISYSAAVPVGTDGIQVSIMNNTLYNLPGASTTYAVPFVLTQAINSLSATSQNNNPAFAPTISCVGPAPYPVGTSCTLYTKISQTGNAATISGNITVSGLVSSTSSRIKNKSMKVQGTNGYLFNVPITVTQNTTGNLITSAINVIVNPADGTSPQTITLLNNGNGSIDSITITPATPTVVSAGANTCTSSLPIGASCTFTVNATLTQNAQSNVVVNYTSNGTSNSLAFNVVYVVPTSAVGLTMLKSGDLTGTVVNSINTINVTVTNSQSTTLTNITFTPQSALPTGMTYTGNGSCLTNGLQTLSAGQKCTLQIQYFPLATASGTFILRETAQYTTTDGQLASYTAATSTISYSAITGQAFVYITPNYVAYGIKAESADLTTQVFVIVNAGPVPTTVNPTSIANPGVTAYTLLSTTGACAAYPGSFQLNAAGSGTESCTITTQFGPTLSTISTTSQMLATYTTGNSTATAFSTLSFTSSPAALVSILSKSQTGINGGNGTSGSPYTFNNSPESPPIQFTITYQNTGTQNAESFNVALNTLPVGYYQSGGTCGTGASITSLAASGGTCTVLFSAESTALFNSYSLNGVLTFNYPGFSYKDTTTGLNTNKLPTLGGVSTVYVTAQALANVSESPASWATGGISGTQNLTFTASPAVTTATRITFQNPTFYSFAFPSGNSCTIAAAGTTCNIPVTYTAGTIITTVYFLFLVAPNAFPTSGITKSGNIIFTS